MKNIIKMFHYSVVTTLVCSTVLIRGMELSIQKPQLSVDSLSLLPDPIIDIASRCQPHEKNTLMQVCKTFFNICVNNKDAIIQANPSTVSKVDKLDSLYKNVRAGNAAMVQLLLHKEKITPPEKTPNEKADPWDYLLISAITKGHLACLVAIVESMEKNGFPDVISQPIELFSRPVDKFKIVTPLYLAAWHGCVDIVKFLINKKVDMKAYGESPLHRAAQAEDYHHPNIGVMLGKEKGVNLQDYIDITKLLIEAGADVNHCEEFYEETPLHVACRWGHYEIAKLLLNAGADIKLKTTHGSTAFQIAQRNNHKDIAILLRNHGLCMQKLITEGVDAASELAFDLGYNSNMLYNNVVNMKANGKSLSNALDALTLDELKDELSPLNELQFLDNNGNENVHLCSEISHLNDDSIEEEFVHIAHENNNQKKETCCIQ